MRISVAMAAYNGEKYIKEQCESILQQMHEEDELIVSVNQSSDNTETILLQMKEQDNRISVFNCSEQGVIANFENAIRNCNNEVIFLADQDDVWMPDKIDVMLKYFGQYDCVVCDAEIVDQFLDPVAASYFKIRKSGPGIAKNIWKNTYMGCCMAFKRSMLNKILPFPRNIPMHDSWIGLICEVYGQTAFIDRKLIKYRRHDTNASNTASASTAPITKKIQDRMNLLINLLKRILFEYHGE